MRDFYINLGDKKEKVKRDIDLILGFGRLGKCFAQISSNKIMWNTCLIKKHNSILNINIKRNYNKNWKNRNK